jgi:hypothetical protein
LLNNKKHYICDIHLSQEYLPIADHEKDHQFKFNEPGDSNQNSHRIPSVLIRPVFLNHHYGYAHDLEKVGF